MTPGQRQHAEKALRVAGQLYEIRDAVRRVLGPNFRGVMERHVAELRQIAAANRCSVLNAATQAASEVSDNHEGWAALIILAAAVEDAEPTVTEEA